MSQMPIETRARRRAAGAAPRWATAALVVGLALLQSACGGGDVGQGASAVVAGQDGRAHPQALVPTAGKPAFASGAVYALRSVANPDLLLKGLSTGEPVFAPTGYAIPKAAQLNLVDVRAGASHCFRLTLPDGAMGQQLGADPGSMSLAWKRLSPGVERLCAEAAPGGVGFIVRSGTQVLSVVKNQIQFVPAGGTPSATLSTGAAWEFVLVTPAAANRAPVNVAFTHVQSNPSISHWFEAVAFDPDGIVQKMELYENDVKLADFELEPSPYYAAPFAVVAGFRWGTTVRIKATDERGAVTWSAPLLVQLDARDRPVPASVTLTGVRDGSTRPVGSTLSMDAKIFQPELVRTFTLPRVEIYNGTVLLASRPYGERTNGRQPPILWTPTEPGRSAKPG
jgi:hypothetical protein